MTDSNLPSGRPPTSVLLLGPGFGGGERDVCAGLLATAEADDVLYVSYAGNAADRLEHFRDHDDAATARAVLVGDPGGIGGGTVPEGFESVETVNAPSDLTGLGIALTEQLGAADGHSAVCFDSATALLQYVDVDTAFEFLHVLVGRLYRNDATGHLHVDPSAHDERTVARLASLVDGRVVAEEDGSVTDVSSSLRAWEA